MEQGRRGGEEVKQSTEGVNKRRGGRKERAERE